MAFPDHVASDGWTLLNEILKNLLGMEFLI